MQQPAPSSHNLAKKKGINYDLIMHTQRYKDDVVGEVLGAGLQAVYILNTYT